MTKSITERRPSRPPLTDEQRAPLIVRNASVALSSGAGCGKTTVLTERFLDTLSPLMGSPIHSTVAMTFTEKAARELRKRIRDAVRDKLETATDDDVRHWRQTLGALDAASISTFHQFCAGLLRTHALLAGIDPDFSILDATISATLRSESLAHALRRKLAENDAGLVELAVEYGMTRVQTGLSVLIDQRGAGSLEDWVEKTPEELVGVWIDLWETRGKALAKQPLIQSATRCRKWFAEQAFENPKIRILGACMLTELLDIDSQIDRPEWLEWLRNQAMMPKGLKVEAWPSIAIKDQTQALLKDLREEIDEWTKKGSFDEATSLKAATFGLHYARLALDARASYDQAKRKRGGLDFDDLIHLTRNLLETHADVIRNDPDRPISFLLVDEFQDTDPVQSAILRLLGGANFTTGGLFLVGDFKQSIYGFRGARPDLFTSLRNEFPEAGRLNLSENFRSVPGVLDFVNALFADAFPQEGDIRLRPGPRAFDVAGTAPVEFIWSADEAEENSESAEKPDADERRKLEARGLARLIRERLDEGWGVRGFQAGEVRRAGPGDIAFLFRAMTNSSAYEAALAAEGLDYHVVGGASFYARQEIEDVINVLSVVEDPEDPLALAGALRGPFFGLSDNGLYLLAEGRRGHLAEGLRVCDQIDSLSATDRERAIRARRLLVEWRKLKDHVPISALVDRILDESGFEAALPAEFLGDRKRANARKLVRLARQFDARGGFTLTDFVGQLRQDLRRPPREDQAATTDEEGQSIRLMSIHQSKGLEFPIVILPELNRKPEQSRGSVAFGPDLGPLVRLGKASLDPDPATSDTPQSLGWKIHGLVERVEDEAEAARLFYVATTRARDVLVLSAAQPADSKPLSVAMRLLDERFDRQTGACRAALPGYWNQPRVSVTSLGAPAKSDRPKERSVRPDLVELASLITGAHIDLETPIPPPTHRPRFIDLEIPRRLPPRSARLDRLRRAILAQPGIFDPNQFNEIARNVGRRQVPPASIGLVEEAVRLLEPWIAGPIGKLVADSSRCEHQFEWTLAWPKAADRPTVFRGSADLLVFQSDAVDVVTFSDPAAPERVERLENLLAARAVIELGLGQVRSSRRILLGERGQVIVEDDFSDMPIDDLITRLDS